MRVRFFSISVIVIAMCMTVAFGQTPASPKTGYAPVNGLKLYYEIHGVNNTRPPLVLIHGGGSTITTTFGTILPSLAKNRKIIAVELQAHGHTADIDRPETFEQDADDVAALLKELKITQADFLGFSNGGSTTLQIAIRHPKLAHKLVVASAIYKRDGIPPQFWEWMKNASLENMPPQLKEAYLKVAPNPKDLIKMHDKDAKRMVEFTDWQEDDIRSITSPTLVINGDADVVRPEHAVEMFRLLPNAKLAILPGGHGEYIGEILSVKEGSKLPAMTVALIEEFLDTQPTERSIK